MPRLAGGDAVKGVELGGVEEGSAIDLIGSDVSSGDRRRTTGEARMWCLDNLMRFNSEDLSGLRISILVVDNWLLESLLLYFT